MMGVGRTRVPLRGFYVAMLVLLYLPIALLFVFSFNARRPCRSRCRASPPSGTRR